MKKLIFNIALVMLCISAAAQTKTVSILGDSYSTFEGYLEPDTNYVWYFDYRARTNTDVTKVTQTWWHQLISSKGWRLLKNNSCSGSTICNTGYRQEDVTRNSFLARMDNLGGAPDIIYIFGGTNDAWANSPIGEYKYEGWNFDIAYQYNTTKGTFYPFQPDMTFTDIVANDAGVYFNETNISTPTDVKFNRHQLLFTIGYTF